ncbi:MAG: DUF3135 domain-containing protein [Deltaproteobacteria bacterium]|nr:DUF3135 domain-containing protein [Deltaproteobacteria bacterium]
MKKIDWEREKEINRKEAIENHERLHKLFVENRFLFEQERKRMIEEVINGAKSEKQKDELKALQKSWDDKMRKAGTNHNRLVLAKHILMKHIDEVWNPSLRELSKSLKQISCKYPALKKIP